MKRKWNKILSIVLATAVVITALPTAMFFSAHAEENVDTLTKSYGQEYRIFDEDQEMVFNGSESAMVSKNEYAGAMKAKNFTYHTQFKTSNDKFQSLGYIGGDAKDEMHHASIFMYDGNTLGLEIQQGDNARKFGFEVTASYPDGKWHTFEMNVRTGETPKVFYDGKELDVRFTGTYITAGEDMKFLADADVNPVKINFGGADRNGSFKWGYVGSLRDTWFTTSAYTDGTPAPVVEQSNIAAKTDLSSAADYLCTLSRGMVSFRLRRDPENNDRQNLLTIGEGEETVSVWVEDDLIGMTSSAGEVSGQAEAFNDNPTKWFSLTLSADGTSLSAYVDDKTVFTTPYAGFLIVSNPETAELAGSFTGKLEHFAVYDQVLDSSNICTKLHTPTLVTLEEEVERPLPDAADVFRSEKDTRLFASIKAEAAPGDSKKRLHDKALEGDPEIMGKNLLGTRIPGLLTSHTEDPNDQDVLIAAADIGNNGADWGNLNSGIRRSLDGGKTWSNVITVCDPPTNDADEGFYTKQSAFLIDPMMAEAPNGDAIILTDLFPEYRDHKYLEDGPAYKEIDGKKYQLLFTGTLGARDRGDEFTLREGGWIWNEQTGERTNYYVPVNHSAEHAFATMGDMYYAVGDQDYPAGVTPPYIPEPPTNQEGSNDIYVGNMYLTWEKQPYVETATADTFVQKLHVGPGGTSAGFDKQCEYEDWETDPAPLRVSACMYLVLLRSTDHGETWQQPVDITPQLKMDYAGGDGPYLAVGPGRCLTLENQEDSSKNGRILMPLYRGSYYPRNYGANAMIQQDYLEEGCMAYSDDNGITWQRATSDYKENYIDNKGEIQCIEQMDGTIMSFGRRSVHGKGPTPVSYSYDGGETWGPMSYTNMLAVKSQKSFIAYPYDSNDEQDKTDDPRFDYPVGLEKGKQYVLSAHPTGWNTSYYNGCNKGAVTLGEVQPDNTINWIAERSLVLEDNVFANTGASNMFFFSYSCMTILANGNIGIMFEPQPNNYIAYAEFNLAWLLAGDSEGFVENMTVVRNIGNPEVLDYTAEADGSTLGINIDFSEVVMVHGAPSLEISVDGTPLQARYDSGSATKSLRFTAELPAGYTEDSEVLLKQILVNKDNIAEGVLNGAVLSGEEEVDYPVSIGETITGGKITVSSERAVPGEIITVTVSPENGKVLKRLYYQLGQNQTEIPKENGTYRFIMPEGAVTVVAEFQNQIVDPIKVTSVTLNKSKLTLTVGGKDQLTAQVMPVNAENKGVTWSSSNDQVASVDQNGTVTAKGGGKAVVTAAAKDGSQKSSSCSIEVGYAVKYNLNKGKNHGGNPSIYMPDRTITLKKPARKGYAFAGWYQDSKFKKKITKLTKNLNGNITLYAKWTKVKVGKVTKLKVTGKKARQMVVSFKKVTGAKGYQIQYAKNKRFKNDLFADSRKLKKTIKKVEKGTYYVRVRAYKMDSAGSRAYGKYSKVVSVKIK